jgi:tRNA A37 threonylcarbamoyladenosine synthetase subunit TsaC/SUA5/YrdC
MEGIMTTSVRRRGNPAVTTPEHVVKRTIAIDAIYRAGGLPLREPS